MKQFFKNYFDKHLTWAIDLWVVFVLPVSIIHNITQLNYFHAVLMLLLSVVMLWMRKQFATEWSARRIVVALTKDEITCLTDNHPVIITKPHDVKVFIVQATET